MAYDFFRTLDLALLRVGRWNERSRRDHRPPAPLCALDSTRRCRPARDQQRNTAAAAAVIDAETVGWIGRGSGDAAAPSEVRGPWSEVAGPSAVRVRGPPRTAVHAARSQETGPSKAQGCSPCLRRS